MAVLANPIGNFPLNDDWAYGYSVKTLVEAGDFQLSGWSAANLLSQILWGALFCLPMGFSFTALRFSTLTLGLVGVIATYALLRELSLSRKVALVGAAVVAVNPLYFGLANTFMNDVPSVVFSVLSVVFLVRGLKHDSIADLVIGCGLAYVALLSRQVAAVVLFAFGLAYLRQRGISWRNSVIGWTPLFLGVVIQSLYKKGLELTDRLPASYGNQINTLKAEVAQGLLPLAGNVLEVTPASLVYLGFFLLPFLLVTTVLQPTTPKSQGRSRLPQPALAMAGVGAVIFLMMVAQQRLMPLFEGQVLSKSGLGPIILKGNELAQIPSVFWGSITALGVIGAGCLLVCWVRLGRSVLRPHAQLPAQWTQTMTLLLATSALLYGVVISLLGISAFGFYDRYLIFLLPFLLAIIALSVPPSTAPSTAWKMPSRMFFLALVLLLLYGGFTTAITHDYLTWNRTRWQALNQLTHVQNISPRQIDGGFEFNGWYLYDDDYDDWLEEPEKSWYWVDRDDYLVSLNPVLGYREINRYPFTTWLPPQQQNILVLWKEQSLD